MLVHPQFDPVALDLSRLGIPIAVHWYGLTYLVAFGLFLWLYARKQRKEAQVSAVFLVGYGLARFTAEYFREPDSFLGILALNMSMGQWLCIPMILGGVLLWVWAETRNAPPAGRPARPNSAAR
jgi:phosphatidylglycerol:prolipoprotein diacylglycerol transferase